MSHSPDPFFMVGGAVNSAFINFTKALSKRGDTTENLIKKETKATIRCIPIDSKNETGECLFSGKPSEKRVLFAKNY